MAPSAVFTISAGRTGTHYLETLFACVAGARSRHEDLPIGVGPEMGAFNEGDEAPMRGVAALKARIARRGPGPYLEANHAFIKGYGWFLPELLGPESLAVIYLRRDPGLVASSLLRVRGVPGRTWWSRLWYLAPGQAKNLSQPPPEASALELCRWYAEEIDRRALAYRERFPEVTFVEVTLEELNDYAFVSELLGVRLGLPVDEGRLRAAVGRRTPDLNREFASPPDLSDLELRDPDALEGPPYRALQAELVTHLAESQRAELLLREPGLVGETIMLSVVRVVTGRSRELSQRFGVALPNTRFEIELILALLIRLRPLDPMGLLFLRLPDGSYTLPALNSAGGLGDVLPLLLGNALRRSLGCRALLAGAFLAAALALAALLRSL